MMISAGLKGIEEKLDKPKPSEKNVYHLSQKERDELGIKNLPSSLDAAITLAEKSSLTKEILGERFLDDYIKIKKEESEEYGKDPKLNDKERLTDYELNKLLPVL